MDYLLLHILMVLSRNFRFFFMRTMLFYHAFLVLHILMVFSRNFRFFFMRTMLFYHAFLVLHILMVFSRNFRLAPALRSHLRCAPLHFLHHPLAPFNTW